SVGLLSQLSLPIVPYKPRLCRGFFMTAIPGGHSYGRSLTRREKSLPAIFYDTEKVSASCYVSQPTTA
ncbi:MAG: hypothetical protein P1V33_00745, partial [Pseudohongiella nitratireducens]